MFLKIWVVLFVAVLSPVMSVLATDFPVTESPTSESSRIDVTLTNHVDFPLPMPVQDVYIVLNDTTPNLVYRADVQQARDPEILAKEAYSTTNHTPHDPLMSSPHPVGPFPRGKDLGFTLADWLGATGGGTYIESEGNATMNFTFQKLVPNGTYTVWWAGVTRQPEYRFVVAPAGATDGSENAFQADAAGNGVFHAQMQALPPGTNETRTLIVVRYHSDGKVPGATPGPYGETAHVQLLYRMPLPESPSIPAARAAEAQPGFESILTFGVLLSAVYLIWSRRE